MKDELPYIRQKNSGYSVIELFVVLGVIALLSVISLPYIVNYKKAYKSEDQALKVIDLMREAGQVAMARRRTIRFEIDLTDNAVLIIDENNAAPDTRIKRIPLENVGDVRIDAIPTGVNKPNPPNYTNIVFANDSVGHFVGDTNVNGNSVWSARFRSDGTVVNNANIPISVNIYSWPPITPGSTTPRNRSEVRAITLFGGSGAVRYWKHNGTTFIPNQ